MVGNIAVNIETGKTERFFSKESSGVDHTVAPHLSTIAHKRAQFFKACIDLPPLKIDVDGLVIEPQIGTLDPCPQVDIIAKNGVADVIEVRGHRPIEQYGVFHFRIMPNHTPIAGNYIPSKIRPMANRTIISDDARALDINTWFNNRVLSNTNSFRINEIHRTWNSRLNLSKVLSAQIVLQTPQCLPRVLASLK